MTLNDTSLGTNYHIPWWVRVLRAIGVPLLRLIFRLFSRVRISGLENIPKKSAYLAAINHISLFEPPLVVAFWPYSIEALGGAAVFSRPGQGLLAKAYGTIPVKRGSYDRWVLDMVVNVLRSGYPLMLAPEGGRSHEPAMRRAKPGVAYLVERADVPVVPVALVGTSDDTLNQVLRLERPQLEMRIGEPFSLPPVEGKGAVRRAARQRNADLVMKHIAALLPPEYHGVYADLEIPEPETAASSGQTDAEGA